MNESKKKVDKWLVAVFGSLFLLHLPAIDSKAAIVLKIMTEDDLISIHYMWILEIKLKLLIWI